MEELAQVYGRSLFQVALEKGRLDEIREQLGQFADALDELVSSGQVDPQLALKVLANVRFPFFIRQY